MFQQQQQPQQPQTNILPNAATTGISNGVTNTIGNIKNTFADTKNTFQQSIDEFSSASALNAGSEFLETNSLVAKFGFIILILFGFLFMFRIGMIIISSILSPSTSPYLVKGLIQGSESVKVEQDTRTSSAIVGYSENEPSGLEFSYSVWLTFSDLYKDGNYHHIFNKGIIDASNISLTGVNNLSNAPGLYVKSNADGTNSLRVYMDTFSKNGQISKIDEQRTQMDIDGIPFNKWVNVIIRVQNRILDIYINGVLTQHKDLGYVPKQNFGDVYVCQNGGFAGKLSNLRYYPKGLNVFEINGIVGWGPNLSTSSASKAAAISSDTSYLSYLWYKGNQ